MITPTQVLDAVYSYRSTPRPQPSPAIEIAEHRCRVFARGSDEWAATLPVARARLVRVADRQALQQLCGCDEWFVWLEEGNKLAPNWEDALRAHAAQPGICGRVNRTSAGLLYPYPGGFAMHASLLTAGEPFPVMFAKAQLTYRPIDGIIQLSTRPAQVA